MKSRFASCAVELQEAFKKVFMKKSLQNQRITERVKSGDLAAELVSILAVMILIGALVFYSIKSISEYQAKTRITGYGEVE